MKMYNIDTNFIYLTGLSYGGRHAVIVSMDTDNGPIPNLRGVIPFAAGTDSEIQPNYASISDFAPACICIGLDDAANFITVSNTLHNDIQTNGGTSMLNEVVGVGHTVAFPTYPDEMMECINFIESQYIITYIGGASLNKQQDIAIHPNPTATTINIIYPESLLPIEVYIIDVSGRKLMNIQPGQRKIDVSDLPNGIKTLVIVTDETVITKRISVIH